MCSSTDTKVVTEPLVKSPGLPSQDSERHARNSLDSDPPVESVLVPPSFLARYTCLSIMVGCFAIWGKYTFVEESKIPGAHVELQPWQVPLTLTAGYLVSLPLLWQFSKRYLLKTVNVKLLLRESMVLYNAGQVIVNLWMVYRILDALLFRGHPFVGGPIDLVDTGATYAVWVHYCDKYLEFFDTYFMLLRGKLDQVSFLHVYHHTSIAWAWWLGLKLYGGGDIYFGALLNSWIHVMMYSYYTLSLLQIQCPWKKYLTQAQLAQFMSVVAYSIFSMIYMSEKGNWRHYLAAGIQVFEMVSLFVLFMGFYRKAYSKDKLRRGNSEAVLSSAATESDAASDADANPEHSSVSSQSSEER